jgi:hypothetical protein
MLTKNDLKEIRKVIREEVEAEVKDSTSNIEGTVRLSALNIRNDVDGLDDRLKNVGVRTDRVLKDMKTIVFDALKPVKKDLNYLKKTINIAVRRFDEADVKMDKRVRKIEDHLDLPETN